MNSHQLWSDVRKKSRNSIINKFPTFCISTLRKCVQRNYIGGYNSSLVMSIIATFEWWILFYFEIDSKQSNVEKCLRIWEYKLVQAIHYTYIGKKYYFKLRGWVNKHVSMVNTSYQCILTRTHIQYVDARAIGFFRNLLHITKYSSFFFPLILIMFNFCP